VDSEAARANVKELSRKNFVLLGAKRELRRLFNYLHDGEEVIDIVTGSRLGKYGRGIIVATNERLMIIWDGWILRENQDFPYETISGIEFKVGLFFGVLTVYGKGDETSYNWVGRKSGSVFVKTVRRLVAKSARNPHVGVSVSTAVADDDPTLSERMEALIVARDSGVISFDEFAARRDALINQIAPR